MVGAEYLTAQYVIETPFSVEKIAHIIAGEQSTGSFLAVAGEQAVEQFRGRVDAIEVLGSSNIQTLSSGYISRLNPESEFTTARIKIAFPYENVGNNLSTWWTTVAGNLFELGELSGIRLEKIKVPNRLVEESQGPQFGVAGTRTMTGVQCGPVIGTIIKPSVGFSPAQYAQRVRELCEAGVDFIKDDELMANPPHCPIEERINSVMAVINEHAQKTGKKVMYAFNISGECDAMKRHHDTVLDNEGTCVMVVMNTLGLSGIETLRRHGALPIHGHRSGWGMLTRASKLGADFQPYQLIHRLAGIDQMHISGMAGKFWDDDADVILSGCNCLSDLSTHRSGKPVMPVMSAGQWGGQAPEIFRQLGSSDVMYLAGGGIQGHPDGMASGVIAIREAWQAAVTGVPLHVAAKSCAPLASSLRFFGERN